MIRRELLGEVFIPGGYELYDFNEGFDQAYINFPCVFPTMTIELAGTDGLNTIADRMRRDAGFKTLFDNYCNDGDCANCQNDCQAWYNFYIDLNGFNDHHIDSRIFCWISELSECDDMQTFYIDLNDEEQEYIYKCIDNDLRETFGETCETLLRKVADNQKEVAGGELTILERRAS